MRLSLIRLMAQVSMKSNPTSVVKPFDYEGVLSQSLDAKRRDNSYRVFKKILRSKQRFPVASETSTEKAKDITVWCSNDYLDLSMHPAVQGAIKEAVTNHGTGSGGSRSISGNSPIHQELESELARFHQKEAGLVFSSGFVANDTALHTLGNKLQGLEFFSDAGNHASMIAGIRNSRCSKQVFRHNDVDHLDEVLSNSTSGGPKMVVFETIHSMDGSIAPAEEMCDIAHHHGALTFVDEVHAVGMYGATGAGIGQRDDCVHKMDVISSTLGKAFGVMGGYIVGPASVVDAVRSFGNGFIFTTALPPHIMAGCLESLKIIQSEKGRQLREKLHRNVRYLRKELEIARIPCIPGHSHVIPVMVGDAAASTRLSNELIRRYGIYVQPINSPSVPQGTERLRVAPTPSHDRLMMERFVDKLAQLWKENNLPLQGEDVPRNDQVGTMQ